MKAFGKYFLLGVLVGTVGTSYAQDSYDAQTMANSDLNGTARFVSMGGALGALGGDISVMSTNPAGTAMYRKSDAAISVSELFSGKGAMDHDGYRFSLDQGGILIAFDMDNPSSKGLQFVNFGVNYQKKRNFLSNQLTNVKNLNNTFSQTFQIADLCNYAYANDYWGTMADMSASSDSHGGILDESADYGYAGIPASDAYYEKATYGANVQADVNLSFNVSDQFFFGASIGVYDIDYKRESFYQELGTDGSTYDFSNWYETGGDGFDVKLGFICRPIEDSPFRFGVSVHTPIWYRMTDANGATLYLNDDYVTSAVNEDYDYHYRSPWTFGVSLGHTVGTNFAIGAEYEFQDLSSAKYSDVDGYSSNYFRNVNDITKKTLKGQHTIKIGAEYKPIDALSLRVGYNFVSSPFKSDAYRTIGYDGIYTETDWTNWKAINRFTVGLGYRYKGGYFDLAYQYQAQNGDFYAFDNDVDFLPTKINANRSQIMATLGFRF
ncbi:MAG: hypothetical protein IJV33_08680 [Bacteroidaceae bacterium]|nr:hypothetical protein [Bacteroidaceae bacterium]